MEEVGAKVIDLQAFRTRKALVGERRVGVQQAFRATGPQQRPAKPAGNDADLSERIERIKSSIARINQLMAELRSMSSDESNKPIK